MGFSSLAVESLDGGELFGLEALFSMEDILVALGPASAPLTNI